MISMLLTLNPGSAVFDSRKVYVNIACLDLRYSTVIRSMLRAPLNAPAIDSIPNERNSETILISGISLSLRVLPTEPSCGYVMRSKNDGFTLIELLITIVLTFSGLMALMNILSIAVLTDSDHEYRLKALYLANERLEELKDSDYSLVASETERSISGFPWVEDRIVTVNEISNDLKDVQVDVRWTHKDDRQSVQVRTYIAEY